MKAEYGAATALPDGMPKELPETFINTHTDFEFIRNVNFYSWGSFQGRPGLFVKHEHTGDSGCIRFRFPPTLVGSLTFSMHLSEEYADITQRNEEPCKLWGLGLNYYVDRTLLYGTYTAVHDDGKVYICQQIPLNKEPVCNWKCGENIVETPFDVPAGTWSLLINNANCGTFKLRKTADYWNEFHFCSSEYSACPLTFLTGFKVSRTKG